MAPPSTATEDGRQCPRGAAQPLCTRTGAPLSLTTVTVALWMAAASSAALFTTTLGLAPAPRLVAGPAGGSGVKIWGAQHAARASRTPALSASAMLGWRLNTSAAREVLGYALPATDPPASRPPLALIAVARPATFAHIGCQCSSAT